MSKSNGGGEGPEVASKSGAGQKFLESLRKHSEQQKQAARATSANRGVNDLAASGRSEMNIHPGPTQHDAAGRKDAEQRYDSMKKETKDVNVSSLASTTNPVAFGRRSSKGEPSAANRIRQKRNSKGAQNRQQPDASATAQPNKDQLKELAEKVENVVDPQSVVEQVLDQDSPEVAAVDQEEEVETQSSSQESEFNVMFPDQGFSDQSEKPSIEVLPLTEENLRRHNQQFDGYDQAAEAQNNQNLANAAANLGEALYKQGMGTNSDSSQKNQDLEQDLPRMPEEEQQDLAQQAKVESAVDAAGVNPEEVVDGADPGLTDEEIKAKIEEEKKREEQEKFLQDEESQEIETEADLEEQEFEDLQESIAKEAQQDQAEEQSELVGDGFTPPEGHNTPERQERMEKAHQEIEAGRKAKEMEAAEARAQAQTPESLKDAETPPEGQNAEQAETLQNAQNQKVETASVGTQTDPQSTGKNTDLANSDDTPQSPDANPSASRPGGQSNDGVFSGDGFQESASQPSGDKVLSGDRVSGFRVGNLPQQPGGGGVGAGAGAGAGSRRELSEFDAITDAIQNRVLIPQQLALYSEYYKGQPDLPHDRKLEGLQKFREEVLATDQGRDFVENIMRNPQFQREMQQIETDGYRFVNQKFQHQFHDIAWPAPSAGARSSTITNPQGQAVCTLSESSISQPSNFTLANGSVRPVSSYRKINFPTRLNQPNGPMHLEMALKDENGQNMPDDGAVYFTAHYNKAGQLTEVSSPVPVKFMGKGDDAIGYIERIGSDGKPHVYTLPVTQGNYKSMMQEVARNNGLGVNMSKGMDQSQALSRDRAATVGIDSPAQQQMMDSGINPQSQQQTISQGFRAGVQQGQAAMQAAEQRMQSMQMSSPQPKAKQPRTPAPQVDAAIARMQAQIQQKQAAVAKIKSKKGGGKTTKGSTTRALKKAEKAVADIELLNSRKIYALEKALREKRQSTENPQADLTGTTISPVMGYNLKKVDQLAQNYKLNTKIPPAAILDRPSGRVIHPQELFSPSSEASAAIDQLRAQVWQERAKLADVEMAKESRMSRAGLASDRHLEQLHKVQDIEALNARKIKILQENPEADKSEVDKIMRQGAAELGDKLTNREKEVFRLQSQSELQMPVIYNQQAPNVNRAVEQLQSQMWSKRADLAKMRTADPKKLAKAESAVQKIEELNSRKILALQTMLEQERERSQNPQADLKASRVDNVMKRDLSKTNVMLNSLGLDLEAIDAVQTSAGPTTPAAPSQPSSPVLDEAIKKLHDETREAKDEARKLSQKKVLRASSTKKVEEAQARAEQIAKDNAKKEKIIQHHFDSWREAGGYGDLNRQIESIMLLPPGASGLDNWIEIIDKEEAKLAAKSTGPKILDSVATQDPVATQGPGVGDEGVQNQTPTMEEFKKLTPEQKRKALLEFAESNHNTHVAETLLNIAAQGSSAMETAEDFKARLEYIWSNRETDLKQAPDNKLDQLFDRALKDKELKDMLRARDESRRKDAELDRDSESEDIPLKTNRVTKNRTRNNGVTGTTSQPVNADPLETKRSAAHGVVATSQNPTNFTDGMSAVEQDEKKAVNPPTPPISPPGRPTPLNKNMPPIIPGSPPPPPVSESNKASAATQEPKPETPAAAAQELNSATPPPPPPQVGDPVKLKPPSAPPPPPPPLEKKREMLVGHVSALQKEATDPKVKILYANALKKIPTLQEERVDKLLTKNQTSEFSRDLESLVPPPPPGTPETKAPLAAAQAKKTGSNSLDDMISTQTSDLAGSLKKTAAAAQQPKPASPDGVKMEDGRGVNVAKEVARAKREALTKGSSSPNLSANPPSDSNLHPPPQTPGAKSKGSGKGADGPGM